MPTFALNMIVGPNEAEELNRCLSSINAKQAFDEIVITLTSNDAKVEEVANKWATKVLRFDWTSERHPYGNFGGARQCSLDATNSDWVMWLDADDVILDQYKEAWMRLSAAIRDGSIEQRDIYPCIMLPYAVVHDINGLPQTVFQKERIFKRLPQYRWERPVHECLVRGEDRHRMTRLNNVTISHMPAKPNYVSAVRNVRILKHELECGNDDTAIRYYLGRDSMLSGEEEYGVSMLESIVDNMDGSYDDLNTVAIDILFYYAYKTRCKLSPHVNEIAVENETKIESWARYAMSCSMEHAEPLVILGDLYYLRGLSCNDSEAKKRYFVGAEKLYAAAMTKQTKSGALQNVSFYKEVPAERLARIYASRGQWEKSLFYNRQAIDAAPANTEYKNMRKSLLDEILHESNV